jgi:uracil permease
VFGDLLATIPSAVIGGASIVLFGMISASGLRVLVDAKVDFTDTRNMMIVSVILATGLGLGALSLAGDIIGALNLDFDSSKLKIMAGSVEISPLAIATVLGILLNIIYPTEENVEKLRAKISSFIESRKKGSKKSAEDTSVEQTIETENNVEAAKDVPEIDETQDDVE